MGPNDKPFFDEVVAAIRKAFIYVAFFSLFINAFMLTIPIYMLQVFDRVLASHSYETLLYLTFIALFFLVIFGMLSIVRSKIMVRTSHWFDEKVSPEALKRSADDILLGESYPPQSFQDITAIRQFIGGNAVFNLFDSPWVPFYLLVIFLLHPILGWIGTAGAIILFSLGVINELVTRNTIAMANGMAAANRLRTQATMRNAETIQAMGMMSRIVGQWSFKNMLVLALQSKANNRSGTITAISRFIRFTLQILMLGVGAYLVVQNELTPGSMIGATIILSRALAPVEQSIGAWTSFVQSRQSYHRLKSYFAKPQLRAEGMQLPKPSGRIDFDNVYFIPPNSMKPTLAMINFALEAGEMLAVIGPSAAGKSTLAKLLVGAWQPRSGTVRLDGAEIYHWDRNDIGNHVGYLPQNVELFAGSIKDNITRMGQADPEAIIAACKAANVHEMVLNLPEGYNTELDINCSQLSVGQRQRIGLARALYKNPSLLVLDEPNAHLDSDGDAALEQAILAAKKNKTTVIIISHRKSIIRHADKLMLLKEGKLQFCASPEAVTAKLREAKDKQIDQMLSKD